MKISILTSIAAAGLFAALIQTPAQAQYVTFTANDQGAASATAIAAPHSVAEQATYEIAASKIGTLESVTFTNATLGATTSVVSDQLNCVVTDNQSGTGANAGLRVQNNAGGGGGVGSGSSGVSVGFATGTSANFLQVYPPTNSVAPLFNQVTFTFGKAIDSFGAFFTGTQTTFGTETIYFNDGSTESFGLDENNASGGVSYDGFTDSGKSFKAVAIVEAAGGEDHFGISSIEAGLVTPEPSSIVALLIGSVILGAFVIIKKKQGFLQLAN